MDATAVFSLVDDARLADGDDGDSLLRAKLEVARAHATSGMQAAMDSISSGVQVRQYVRAT